MRGNWTPVMLSAGVALGVSVAVWFVATKRLEARLGAGGGELERNLGDAGRLLEARLQAGARELRTEFDRKLTQAESRIRATITDQIAREKLLILQQVRSLIPGA